MTHVGPANELKKGPRRQHEILPGGTRCDRNFFNTHALDTLREVVTVDAVAITNQETRCFFVREGANDLLSCPFGVGIGGNVEANHLSPVVTENDEDVQDAYTPWVVVGPP